MARHTGLPRQLPLSGEGAWASSCARSGPNLPQPVHTLLQWTAAAMESMGGAACPEYIPPSCINDYNVWLVAQLYLPPPDSIFVIAPITYTPAPGPPPVSHGLPTLLATRVHNMYEDDPHLMVAFATLPEAIYHAHKVDTYAVKILHVRPRGDLAPSCAAASFFDLSTPAACDLVQLPPDTARSSAIECGMWLIHKSPRFSALVEHVAPSLHIPMASSPHACWTDHRRSTDALPLSPGAAAIDWTKNRFRGAMVNEAALWLRTFHDSYLNIRPLIAEIHTPSLSMAYVIMPTTSSQPPTRRDDSAILTLTSLIAPTRHALVVNDLADAVALAHRLIGSVTLAVAPVAAVESAVPYDAYIAASTTGATAHRAITHARPSVLELAPTCPGLSFPGETDRLSIPVDGWDQALFDDRNHPDRCLLRLRHPGNTLPKDPMTLDSPSRDGWTSSANVKLLQLVAAWRARSPAASSPVNEMDLSLVTDASLQTPPEDNLLMHAYQERAPVAGGTGKCIGNVSTTE